MNVNVFFRCFSLLGGLLILSGCVAGQNIRLAYEPMAQPSSPLNIVVAVEVNDKRPFITSGDKAPSYIGHYRAGLGNTWDVTTQNKEPLATLIRKDLEADLHSLGFTLGDAEMVEKRVRVEIADWNFDTYINGKFWYDCRVWVLDRSGRTLAEHQLKETVVIKGSFWVGAKYAFEREMPNIYRVIIGKMVRDTPAAVTALKR